MVATGAALLARPRIARAAVREVTLSHIHPAASHYGQACQALAAAVTRHPDLAGSLRVTVHHNAEFGDEVPMLADCRAGTLDMVAVGSFCAFAHCAEIGLLELPFLFTSVARGRSAIDGPIGDDYIDLLRAQDIHVVAWLENGLRQLTANRPIRAPADLTGLKLRVPPSPIAAEAFTALGATVAQVPFLQLYAALRGQVMDAQENPIAIIQLDRLWEVQTYLCLTGHSYSAAMIVAAGDLLSDLTAVQRSALRHCGEWATSSSREVSDAMDRDGLAWLAAHGMVVIDDIDTTRFNAAARRVIDGLRARFTDGWIDRLIRAAG